MGAMDAVTRFSSVVIDPTISSATNNGLYAPQMSTAVRNNINPAILFNGCIIYNTDPQITNPTLQIGIQTYENNTWITGTSSGGVTNPTGGLQGNVPIFADNTGQVLTDSLMHVVDNAVVVGPSVVTLPTLSNIQYLAFADDVGAGIYLGSLTAITFWNNGLLSGDLTCAIFSGGNPGPTSTSVNALVELQSTEGALLLSRLTTAQINAFALATPGMILYNTDISAFQGYMGATPSWQHFGNVSVFDPPVVSKNLVQFASTTGFEIQDSGIGLEDVGNVFYNGSTVVTNDIVVFGDTTGHNIVDSGVLISNLYYAGNPTYLIDTFGAGTQNVGVGTNVLSSITTASFNVGVGDGVLQNLTTGSGNVGIGTGVLLSLTTGSYNVAIGTFVLNAVTTANYNTGLGFDVLLNNTSGAGNTGIGTQALNQNTTGSNNFAFGLNALYANTRGVDNIAIGNNSMENMNDSYNVAIGNYVMAGGSSGEYNIAIGYINFASFQSGNYNVCIGASAANLFQSGGNNTIIGSNALFNATNVNNNTVIGYQSAYNVTNNDNVSIGTQALYSGVNISGNTVVGYQAGFGLVGNDNISIGNQSLYSGANGQNVAIGQQALYNFTDNYSTAIGAQALYSAVTGYNTAVGFQALYNTTGTNNTALGVNAGQAYSYTNCLFVGASADASGGVTNSSAIGAGTIVSLNNAMVLGNNTICVGIGTSSPTYGLHLGAGSGGSYNPQIYISSSSGVATPLTNDGVIAVTSGQLEFTSGQSQFSGAIVTSTSSPSGTNNIAVYGNTTGSVIIDSGIPISSIGPAGYGPGHPTYLLDTSAAFTYDLGVGTNVMPNLTSGYHNVGVGYDAGNSLTTGYRNTLLGNSTMIDATTSYENVYVGYSSGAFGLGNQNVALGSSSMNNLSGGTGSNNVAVGFNALFTLGNGLNNVAVGIQALYTSTDNSSTAVGAGALYNSATGTNTAVGYQALYNLTTGIQNTVVGQGSGFYLTGGGLTSDGNTIVGAGSGNLGAGDSYSFCTFLGADIIPTVGSISGSTAIGYGASVGISGAVVLGNNTANVGIGTSSPTYGLHLGAGAGTPFVPQIYISSSSSVVAPSSNDAVFSVNSAAPMITSGNSQYTGVIATANLDSADSGAHATCGVGVTSSGSGNKTVTITTSAVSPSSIIIVTPNLSGSYINFQNPAVVTINSGSFLVSGSNFSAGIGAFFWWVINPSP